MTSVHHVAPVGSPEGPGDPPWPSAIAAQAYFIYSGDPDACDPGSVAYKSTVAEVSGIVGYPCTEVE